MASLATRRRGTVFSLVFVVVVAKVQSLCYRLLIPLLLLLRFGLWVKRQCLQRHLSVESSMRWPSRFATAMERWKVKQAAVEFGIRHTCCCCCCYCCYCCCFCFIFYFQVSAIGRPATSLMLPSNFLWKNSLFPQVLFGTTRRRVSSVPGPSRLWKRHPGPQAPPTRPSPPPTVLPSGTPLFFRVPQTTANSGSLCSLLLPFGKSNWDLD